MLWASKPYRAPHPITAEGGVFQFVKGCILQVRHVKYVYKICSN